MILEVPSSREAGFTALQSARHWLNTFYFAAKLGLPFVLFVKGSPLPLLERTPSFVHFWLAADICRSWHSLVPTFLSRFPACSIHRRDFLVPLPLLTFSASEKRHLELIMTCNITPPLSAPEWFHCGFESLFQKQQGRRAFFWRHTVNQSEMHSWLYLNGSEWVSVNEHAAQGPLFV